ncbi:MAG: flagellar protein FlaG [Deltaproteobacteria bacterium]|jgi:uncharacterized FlaG/YvyC family protein|nr:flagellar protein FlaG [Deltaproteobacteria bacterium]
MEQLLLNINTINAANNNTYKISANSNNSNSVGQNIGNNGNAGNKSISDDTNTNINNVGDGLKSVPRNDTSNNAEKEKELSKQVESNLNPAPMLSQAMLFKWDSNAGGAVINVVDFKTGKVLAQIPPNSVLKMMANYQKGSLYNGKL